MHSNHTYAHNIIPYIPIFFKYHLLFFYFFLYYFISIVVLIVINLLVHAHVIP